ncbi:hypothetical protein [Streptomyces sp. NPDC060366]|uniref:hypothetical protein n=1 Tax=Streptomyces sp. NPDC060366 TaxID=3347105 RepID=UPI00364BC5D2
MTTRTRRNRKQKPPTARPARKLHLVDQTKPTPRVDLTKPRRPISLVKPQPETPIPGDGTQTPHYFDLQANAASAALYAGSLRIHAPYDTWTGMSHGMATTLTDTGTRLIYTRNPQHLTAHQLCRHDQWHAAHIGGPIALALLAVTVTDCIRHNPQARRARNLGNGIHRARTSAAETQATDVTTLRATHAADNDQTKEHPQT